MNKFRIRQKPVELEAIQWNNNEAEIRDFILNDGNLRFKDNNKLEVWNTESKTWENVPMFHYIVKGLKGELTSVSPELLERTHEIIND